MAGLLLGVEGVGCVSSCEAIKGRWLPLLIHGFRFASAFSFNPYSNRIIPPVICFKITFLLRKL